MEASPGDVSSERDVTQNFTCSARGGPGNTFSWTRLYDSVVVSDTSQLGVVVDDADDGGEYQCTVRNDAGNGTDTVVLRGMCVPSMNFCTSQPSIMPQSQYCSIGNLILCLSVAVFDLNTCSLASCGCCRGPPSEW